eukprot:2263524-Pyramimonas_sp.AAC.1
MGHPSVGDKGGGGEGEATAQWRCHKPCGADLRWARVNGVERRGGQGRPDARAGRGPAARRCPGWQGLCLLYTSPSPRDRSLS